MKTVFRCAVYAVAGLALLLDGLALVDFLLHPLAGDVEFLSPPYRAFLVLVLLPLTLSIAFLIIKRVPGNIIGPLLIVWSGTLANLSIRATASDEFYTVYAGYEVVFGWFGLFMTLLYFPDGKIFSTLATRWGYRLIPLNILFGFLIFLASQNFPEGQTLRRNLLYLPVFEKLYGIILAISLIFVVALLLIILFSVIARFRNGSLLERQQMKWLMFFAGFIAISSILWLILYRLLTGGEVMTPGSGITGILFYSFCGLGPPLTIGVAVLRYRLWDIDRIIRRTLVYSILTLFLTVFYFVLVAVVQNFLSYTFRVTSNSLAIVVSTLAVVAAFTPLRSRIQQNIDRRFFRSKYDAEQVLETFAATARGYVAFEPLIESLLHNVEETMQPEQASLWIKKVNTTNETRNSPAL